MDLGRFVVVVTGANRGIGAAIAEGILKDCPTLTLYATSRRGSDVRLQSRHQDQQILTRSLDISQPQSIESFAKDVLTSHSRVDILVNNAGVNLDSHFTPANVRKTLDTNYYGTLRMCRAFLPIMWPTTGRIVNLSSTASGLSLYSQELAKRFRSASTLDAVETLAQDFLASARNDTLRKDGWPVGRSYSVSKACMNAMTRVLAAENPSVAVNCCCPGWVASDMGLLTGPAPKSLEEGARIPLHLALGDLDGISGKYWGNDSVYDTGSGKVQEQ